jgi:hypothetical protein
MFVYWLLFAIFALGALATTQARSRAAETGPLFTAALAVVVFVIGFRYDVGGDWKTYEFLFSYARYANLDRVLGMGDPGYQFLNWIVQRAGLGFWAVNLMSGAIFVWGLGRLAQTQPSPWLALVVAIPYLVIVVAMGYTRQAVAIGIIMAGYASLKHSASLLRFTLYVALAAAFHKTAVVVLPMVLLTQEKNRLSNAVLVISSFLLLYDIFLADQVDGLLRNYVVAEYSSQGAALRIAMNIPPSLILLWRGNSLGMDKMELNICRSFAFASLLSLIILIVSPSSTAVDRVALYLIPIQLIVLPRIVNFFQRKEIGTLVLIAYAAIIQFTWLNYAEHAQYWLPYRFYPLDL